MSNKLKSFLVFFAFVIVNITYAQVPSVQWKKTIGGSNTDFIRSVVLTTDGGYIIAGSTFSTNGDLQNITGGPIWIVKLDANGTTQWQKCYGGVSGDEALSIIQTNEGGYMVSGYCTAANTAVIGQHGNEDFLAMKLNALGEIEWQKAYGGDDDERAMSVIQTSDGGYALTGYTHSYDGVIMPVNGDITNFNGGSDIWIVRIDSVGTLLWQKIIGSNGGERAYSIIQTTDGGFVVAGEFGISFIVAKLNSLGVVQWQRLYADTNTVYNIKQTIDGGYIIVGVGVTSLYAVTSRNFVVIKTDSLGTTQWRKDYGGNGNEYARSVVLEPDGGYVIAGEASSYYSGDIQNSNGSIDYWIIKINSIGNFVWKKVLGGNNEDTALDIKRTSDGYIVAGITRSNTGDVVGFNGGVRDGWIIKLNNNPLSNDSSEKHLFQIFPNPTKDYFGVTNTNNLEISQVKILDIAGKIVGESYENFQKISLNHLKGGLYFVQIFSNESIYIEKLIVR